MPPSTKPTCSFYPAREGLLSSKPWPMPCLSSSPKATEASKDAANQAADATKDAAAKASDAAMKATEAAKEAAKDAKK